MQIITSFQNNILKKIAGLKDAAPFCFTGGTALSLFYLKHRRSEDLDFFTDKEDFIMPFGRLLEKNLKSDGYEVAIHREFKSFAELKVSLPGDEVVIHLALDAPFYIQPWCQFSDYPGLNVHSLTDIAANKLLALFGRAALRDFIDVYYLIKTGKFSKAQMVDYAKQKDPGFDLYWLGVAFERLKLYQQKDYDLSLVFGVLKEEELLSFFSQWGKEIASSLSG